MLGYSEKKLSKTEAKQSHIINQKCVAQNISININTSRSIITEKPAAFNISSCSIWHANHVAVSMLCNIKSMHVHIISLLRNSNHDW